MKANTFRSRKANGKMYNGRLRDECLCVTLGLCQCQGECKKKSAQYVKPYSEIRHQESRGKQLVAMPAQIQCVFAGRRDHNRGKELYYTVNNVSKYFSFVHQQNGKEENTAHLFAGIGIYAAMGMRTGKGELHRETVNSETPIVTQYGEKKYLNATNIFATNVDKVAATYRRIILSPSVQIRKNAS